MADPRETHNILREERRLYGRMQDELAAFADSFRPPAEVDSETRQKLAALGYVGTFAGETSGPLPDPKTKLHLLSAIGDAYRLFQDGDYARAAESFRRLLAEEPLLVDA